MFLTFDGSTPSGDDKASADTWPNFPDKEWKVYGGPTDLWSHGSITPSQVNAATFGVRLRAEAFGGIAFATAVIDAIEVTVYCALSSSSSSSAVALPSSSSSVSSSIVSQSSESSKSSSSSSASSSSSSSSSLSSASSSSESSSSQSASSLPSGSSSSSSSSSSSGEDCSAYVSGLYHTGEEVSAGTDCDEDDHWTGTRGQVACDPAHGNWETNGDLSFWIRPDATDGNDGCTCSENITPATDTYSLTFQIAAGAPLEQICIHAHLWADNLISAVRINGNALSYKCDGDCDQPLTTLGCFGSGGGIDIEIGSGLAVGNNTIEVDVENCGPGNSPAGFRCEWLEITCGGCSSSSSSSSG